jgi:2-dehydro-3-deoxygluconokinase
MASILGIGECMVELSSEGEGLWRQSFSGDVFNALWYARAYTSEDFSIAFHTALGTDPLSTQMLGFIQSAGIDCEDTPRFEDRRPGLYSIHLDGAERSFTYWRDTSAARMMMRQAETLWNKVENAQIIYLSGITLAILPDQDCAALLNGLRQRKPKNASIVFDPNIRPQLWQNKERMRDVISQAASLSNVVMPSFDDETRAFGDKTPEETATRYSKVGANLVVVKNGPNDTVAFENDVTSFFPVARLESIKDTTAAGDSFNGSYLAATLGGATTREAVRIAQNCASQVIQHKGALVSFSELKREKP